jgi:hypothetical protein
LATHVVDCVGGLVGWDFPEAEAYERHFMARGQFDSRDGHDCGIVQRVECYYLKESKYYLSDRMDLYIYTLSRLPYPLT